jgi:ABC-type Fe3+-siderophore transport system permease subunit
MTTNGRTWLFRIFLGANLGAALFGLTTNMVHTLVRHDPQLPTLGAKVFDELTYFTVQVNWIVVAVCIAYLLNPTRNTAVWRTLRFVALIGIALTGICYYALVASELHFHGVYAVGDVLAHVVSPILYVATWLLFGPRGQATWSGVIAIVVYIGAWTAFTLIRGALTDIYPYGFTDASENGYAFVFMMAGILTLFAFILALGARAFDRWCVRRTASRSRATA